MDNIKSIISKYESKLKWVFIVGLIIHLICCYSRTDYNVILYLLLFLSWESINIGVCDRSIGSEERNYSYFLLLFTILLDIVWLIGFHNKKSILDGFQYGMFTTTALLTIIGIIIKLGLAIALGVLEWEMLKNYLPKTVQEKIAPSQESQKEMMIESA